MEGWLYGLFALLGAFIGGGFSYWGIKTQLQHSDKRFIKELQMRTEAESRQRQWVVRSEPLLKLRDELAVMATKNEKLLSFVVRYTLYRTMTTKDFSEEQKRELLVTTLLDIHYAIEDLEKSHATGSLEKALYALDDKEILGKVEQFQSARAETSATVFLLLLLLRNVTLRPNCLLNGLRSC